MEFLFTTYPAHLTLDVSTNNTTGCAFYSRIGLAVEKVYLSGKDEVEFATFITPPGFVYKPSVRTCLGAPIMTQLVEEIKSVSTRESFEENDSPSRVNESGDVTSPLLVKDIKL